MYLASFNIIYVKMCMLYVYVLCSVCKWKCYAESPAGHQLSVSSFVQSWVSAHNCNLARIHLNFKFRVVQNP